jgi:hypothetical protein
MAEHRYTLIGADKHGAFLETRSDDARTLLRERDRCIESAAKAGTSRQTLYEVIDNDAVDPPERGVVTWCEGCLAEPVLEKAGEASLCGACLDVEPPYAADVEERKYSGGPR